MKEIQRAGLGMALLAGATLATPTLGGQPDGQKASNPAGSIEGKAEAAENNAAHVLNNAGSGSGSPNGGIAGKQPALPDSGPSGLSKKTQHVMGEGNSGMNHIGAPLAK